VRESIQERVVYAKLSKGRDENDVEGRDVSVLPAHRRAAMTAVQILVAQE
jgi:hypothetical protein